MANNELNDRVNKLREDRIAREKARIEKLRELNLKKYNKTESHISLKQSVSSVSVINKPLKSNINQVTSKKNVSSTVQKNFIIKNMSRRPITAPPSVIKPIDVKNDTQKNTATNITKYSVDTNTKREIKTAVITDKAVTAIEKKSKNIPVAKPNIACKKIEPTECLKREICTNKSVKDTNVSRKSIATIKPTVQKSSVHSRMSLLPTKTQIKTQNSSQSVFERLYKPKVVHKETVNNALKLQTDPTYLKKVIRDTNLILNKRHTVFDTKSTVSMPIRRSISAVHFKKISKNELSNCIHKWASIGEKLNKVNLNNVNEDDCVSGEVVVSAVKSERKRVKFQTPVPFNFNTPKPEELQFRLQNWLKKRGKSLDSYHHLQCFGIHHLAKEIKPLNIEPPQFDLDDDENKENVPLESDSDDNSYTENMNEKKDVFDNGSKISFNKDTWRRASYISDCPTDCNESTDTITSNEVIHHIDELLFGALNDLTQLLKEGFDWEQCARWLRAIRDRFPSAPDHSAYWECRAALEERRGDLPASVQCWEEAIAMGTEHSVVEANLDQLLDKFLQLRISPSSGRKRQADPKMLDVKNVFKSTIIRFAVQQAKLRQSSQSDQLQPKFTVTPVRRSARLSTHPHTQTPLRICTSVKQASELGPTVFKPNRTLNGTP